MVVRWITNGKRRWKRPSYEYLQGFEGVENHPQSLRVSATCSTLLSMYFILISSLRAPTSTIVQTTRQILRLPSRTHLGLWIVLIPLCLDVLWSRNLATSLTLVICVNLNGSSYKYGVFAHDPLYPSYQCKKNINKQMPIFIGCCF